MPFFRHFAAAGSLRVLALAKKLFEEIIKGRLTRRGRAGVDGLAGRDIDHGGHQAFCEIGKSVRNAARQRRGRKPQKACRQYYGSGMSEKR